MTSTVPAWDPSSFRVRVQSALDAFLDEQGERLAPLEGVISTSTHFMLKTYKHHGVLMQQDNSDERLSISP